MISKVNLKFKLLESIKINKRIINLLNKLNKLKFKNCTFKFDISIKK